MHASEMAFEQAFLQGKSFPSHSDELFQAAFGKFHQILRKYVLFNAGFFLLAVLEVFCLALGFSFLARSSILAFSLALVFLTGFSYFVLRLYFQARIPDQLKELREEFTAACKNLLRYSKEHVQDRLQLSQAICQFVAQLYQKEYHFYPLPPWLDVLSPIVEKLSCWSHWRDILQMQELLLSVCIYEHLQAIKVEPTSLHAHSSLASVYVLLCTLYQPPQAAHVEALWVPPGKFNPEMDEKFRAAVSRALDEFQILRDLAPENSEVHVQLAAHFRDLQMPLEEIREYETLLRFLPEDKDTLYKLGVLYFEEGFNAKGLRLYDQLKRSSPSLAASLITHYGSFEPLPVG